MDLKPISPEMDELRNVIISSNLTTCYLILARIRAEKSEALVYNEFRDRWIDIYKSTYRMVSKMKPRKPSREETS
jgi:hypothetical protein